MRTNRSKSADRKHPQRSKVAWVDSKGTVDLGAVGDAAVTILNVMDTAFGTDPMHVVIRLKKDALLWYQEIGKATKRSLEQTLQDELLEALNAYKDCMGSATPSKWKKLAAKVQLEKMAKEAPVILVPWIE
jgi:hypothetical protein